MLVKVHNFNSQVSNAELIQQEKEDSNFWILVEEGMIGTDKVKVEVMKLNLLLIYCLINSNF